MFNMILIKPEYSGNAGLGQLVPIIINIKKLHVEFNLVQRSFLYQKSVYY